MAYTSRLEADERAELLTAQQHAAALKEIITRRRELADPALSDELKWAEACSHDIAAELAGILTNTDAAAAYEAAAREHFGDFAHPAIATQDQNRSFRQ